MKYLISFNNSITQPTPLVYGVGRYDKMCIEHEYLNKKKGLSSIKCIDE